MDEDLADADRPAALAQPLLHGFAGAHDTHATDLALEGEAVIVLARWGDHSVRHGGQMVQPLLDEEPDDAVRVEDEVAPVRAVITDLAIDCLRAMSNPGQGRLRRKGDRDSREQGDELGGLRKDGDIFLRGFFRYGRFGLLRLWSVVRSYSLSRGRWRVAAVFVLLCRHRGNEQDGGV